MKYKEFEKALGSPGPPDSWPSELIAMWYFFNNDWERSHNIAQDIPNAVGARIHGLLHWQEGDRWNAEYWYRHAGIQFPGGSIEEEARKIVMSLIQYDKTKR